MWILATFISAFLIGLQDIARKKALAGNSVLLVLLLNVFFCALILAPVMISAQAGLGWFEHTWLAIPRGSWAAHGWVFLKAVIVLASWLSMYFALKYLPITLTAPIHATYPILTLLGAIVIFGERLNLYQWAGILVSVYSL
ncbi:MAG: DMT family transporter, partial [Elusimicrobiaceae bacterium]|nr:DMT family transporter [Elusimicrobiaceae bacterium]